MQIVPFLQLALLFNYIWSDFCLKKTSIF